MGVLDVIKTIRSELPNLFDELSKDGTFLNLVRTDLLRYGFISNDISVDSNGVDCRIRTIRYNDNIYFMVEEDGIVTMISGV